MPVCNLRHFTFNVHIFIFQIGSLDIMKLNTFISSEKVCILLQCTIKQLHFCNIDTLGFNSLALLFVYCLPHWVLTESYSYRFIRITLIH